MVHGVDGGPSSGFRGLLSHTAFFITIGNVLSLPFLLVRVLAFVAAGHDSSPEEIIEIKELPCD